MKTIIIDYGMGNLFSVQKKIQKLGFESIISNKKEDIVQCDKIILPGVGHFSKAMENLKNLNLIETLNQEVIIKRKPILGICLGMQLLAKSSEEGFVDGLNWINSTVKKFEIKDKLKYKIPHIGWNQVETMKSSKLFQKIPELSEFYFVHSFHFQCNDESDILAYSDYEYKFVSAVERDNIFGVQFHPEKSHDVGEQMFENFLKL